MSTDGMFSFGKEEHLCRRTLIDQLFGGGAQVLKAWPLRMVYLLVDKKDGGEADLQVLLSVSKRHFKRAVKRNRVKRQLREAIRHHKQDLEARIAQLEGKQLLVAFAWQANWLLDSDKIESKVEKLMRQLTHGLSAEASDSVSSKEDGQ